MNRLLRAARSVFRRQTGPKYRSRFGGLWTDRVDALEELGRRRDSGALAQRDVERIEHFILHGYVILEHAVAHEHIDALITDVEDAWAHGSDRFRVDILGKVQPLRPSHREQPFKLLDLYVASRAARAVSFSDEITRFLGMVFESPILGFQSLTFENGTEQRLHQDTAYVVVSEPLKLAASWVALEDIAQGTGELEYFSGSHHLPEKLFSDTYKHFSPERDGEESHIRFLDWLESGSLARGLERKRFLPKKGDALIWAADLVHGGSKIEDRSRTRRSHVTHY